MFRNDGGKRFQDVTTAGNFGHLQKGHGVAFGDVDNDGDQDVFEQMGGAYLGDKAYSALYRNPGKRPRLARSRARGRALEPPGRGRAAGDHGRFADGPASHPPHVGSGGSFGGYPMRQEIGLGEARRVSWLEVLWPVTG